MEIPMTRREEFDQAHQKFMRGERRLKQIATAGLVFDIVLVASDVFHGVSRLLGGNVVGGLFVLSCGAIVMACGFVQLKILRDTTMRMKSAELKYRAICEHWSLFEEMCNTEVNDVLRDIRI